MMRFYGMSDDELMQMPVNRFMSLYKAISHLELEEEARWITIFHNGKPNDRMKDINKKLRERVRAMGSGLSGTALGAMASMGMMNVRTEAESGDILAIRERQRAADLRLRAIREAERRGEEPPEDILTALSGRSPSDSMPEL